MKKEISLSYVSLVHILFNFINNIFSLEIRYSLESMNIK